MDVGVASGVPWACIDCGSCRHEVRHTRRQLDFRRFGVCVCVCVSDPTGLQNPYGVRAEIGSYARENHDRAAKAKQILAKVQRVVTAAGREYAAAVERGWYCRDLEWLAFNALHEDPY